MAEQTTGAQAPAEKAEPTTYPVGHLLRTRRGGATVTRPDGSTTTVVGRAYVLDVPGVHVVDGVEVTAR
ncbi:MAG: hypothetical protein OSB43_18000 [Nocardioides sp.]|uniref:hypothetical protein n=1 Tax=Nocardioides sp. TaxID=35761 RepID=UPI0023858EB9|nr:hypothetical protein [Nocardioides sp.]MDE0778177.1 hypothetical protein [Nocardioides sp.]